MTRYALVPVEPTDEMLDRTCLAGREDYADLLAASPGQGAVTAEMLTEISVDFQKAQKRGKPIYDAMKEALENAGLTVQP